MPWYFIFRVLKLANAKMYVQNGIIIIITIIVVIIIISQTVYCMAAVVAFNQFTLSCVVYCVMS